MHSISFISILEFNEAWCKSTSNLKNVTIFPTDQENISYYEDKFIIGKSDLKSDKYDVLIFARRDIKSVSIPEKIVRIMPFAFSGSAIIKVFVHSNVTQIDEGCFSYCNHLHDIEISPDSNLQKFEKESFASSSIKKICVPNRVQQICEGAFSYCSHLQYIEFTNNSELQIIEKNAFSQTSIVGFYIPSNVKKICDRAFFCCRKLQIIEIGENSNLQFFDQKEFKYNLILMIPININIHFI